MFYRLVTGQFGFGNEYNEFPFKLFLTFDCLSKLHVCIAGNVNRLGYPSVIVLQRCQQNKSNVSSFLTAQNDTPLFNFIVKHDVIRAKSLPSAVVVTNPI